MSIIADAPGQCPHCLLSVRFEQPSLLHSNGSQFGKFAGLTLVSTTGGRVPMTFATCPACGGIAIATQDALIWPDTGSRPVPREVQAESPRLAADFTEAAVVLPKSKKASAALSRRCLQMVLTEKGGARSKDLSAQIDDVIKTLPSAIAANVDAIRQVGNFAAHPMKAKNSGEIADVEEGEAEWLLDVLEELFEYYYVAPAQAHARRVALNEKLTKLGKPPLKTP
jgi:hypothetical protein